MRVPVPFFVFGSIVQAEIGGQIDDLFGQPTESFQLFRAAAVWQSQKQNIARLYLFDGAKFQLRPSTQVRVSAVNELPGVAFGGDLRDFDIRVPRQQSQ